MTREIHKSGRFKRDAKRLRNAPAVVADLLPVIDLLAADAPLPPKFRDHALKNDWEGCRDCHIRPDVVLIYKKTADGLVLLLLRVGSHSDLFGK